MKITDKHYQYWIQHKAQVKWYKPKNTISVNELVPYDAIKDDSFATSNTVNLIKSVRNRGKSYDGKTLKEYLWKLTKSPGTTIRPQKRKSLALKWYLRLIKNEKPHQVTAEVLNEAEVIYEVNCPICEKTEYLYYDEKKKLNKGFLCSKCGAKIKPIIGG
jgi:hypothetical protein